MGIRGIIRSILPGLGNGSHGQIPEPEPVPFDNSYRWLWATMERLMADPVASKRPHYVWGIMQGAALGKVLGFERVSVIEVGVAGGAGLLAMESSAQLCEQLVGIKIDVYGFDTGVGIPKPLDYRDMPYKWSEGYYPCDVEELKRRLRRSELRIGLLDKTMPAFIAQKPAPVAFVGFDTGMYSATKDALTLFESGHDVLIPRVPCAFRSAIGKDVSDYGAELLTITEFNNRNSVRKLSPIRGLEYFVPPRFRWWWIAMMYSLHIFDHPLYGAPDAYKLSASIDLNDTEHFIAAG
ncbi:hypothetical protein W02_12800 [Nitrospira sp. KM1]|uniref:hypothetical protein n=1 Tax=Nitrospira sp. KM1 TaxID=1936990 RepID=UPI0013A75BFF|nr:hypothetical protein [Nitrospira sp. KM1]BCA54140.1 hypothetical protein W02_12800 [Nitrospira sp. KM1]